MYIHANDMLLQKFKQKSNTIIKRKRGRGLRQAKYLETYAQNDKIISKHKN